MKCEICEGLGLKSKLNIVSSFTTSMCVHSFYDEDGNYHYHDPNKTHTSFNCSNGHATGRTTKVECPSCKAKDDVGS